MCVVCVCSQSTFNAHVIYLLCGYGRVSPSQAGIMCLINIYVAAVVVVMINVFDSIEIFCGYFL